MKDYIFIFGRDPMLSYLEMKSYFGARKIEYSIVDESEHGVVVKLSTKLDFGKMIKDLGGTSKIAEVVDDLDSIELYAGRSNKIKYAVSAYDADDEGVKDYLKKRMKGEKLKATLKHSKKKEDFTSPSESVNILKEGFEIVMFKDRIAKLIALFNPLEYKRRDTERPAQRPLHMISIRLAKILINLAGAKENDIVLDPFCGIGVLLQEALLMNMNVIGLDVSGTCVDDSRKNLAWTSEKFKTSGGHKVFKGDARELSKFVRSVDVAATEPYMGPFMKTIPTPEVARNIMRKLRPMYDDVLKELKKVVKGRIAIIVPRFRLYNGQRVAMGFDRMLEEHGFVYDKACPIIYIAVKSKIEREIWVIEKA
ncbi:MAG: DNA methyltransferase [Candidatus Woesearchaeota archaeon]